MDEYFVQLGTRIRNGSTLELSEHEEQELYYDLERHRSRLLQLFDVGPRSPEEARDLEKRKYKLDGNQLDLTPELVRPTLFVAEQLQCSEYYCAGLIAKVERRNPNLDATQLVEKTIEVFHGERSALLYCLLAIFEGSADEKLVSTPLGAVLQRFTREVVGTMLSLQGGRRGRLPERMLQEIDRSLETGAKISQLILDAKSNTVPFGGQGAATLSHDVLQMRINCLRGERRQLGYLLFIASAFHHLSGSEIIKLVERLSQKPNDDMVHYILTSTLLSLDLPDPSDALSPPLYKDMTFVATLSKVLDDKAGWKSPRLRTVVSLKWSLFIWRARHQDADLADASSLPPGFGDEEVEKRVWDAVQSDVFTFLSEMTLLVRPRGAVEDSDRPLTGLGLRIRKEGEMDPDVVDEDFKIFVLRAYESLVTAFIVSMSAVIRRIKHRQEDISLAASRSNRPGAGGRHSNTDDTAAHAPRNDIAELFEFIGVLYTCLPPDDGLKFWVASTEPGEGKLFAFIRWATESRERTLISAAYDMLAGIAKGRSSAEVAYNFLSSGQSENRGHGGMLSSSGNAFTWTTLFGALTWWAETLSNPHAQHHHQEPQELNFSGRRQQPGLSDAEALMVGAFLRLLRVVVKHAPAARIALYSMPDFRIIPTLLALLQHSIQLEIKGIILDALAAFCESGAGVQGVEICKNIWAALERAELINLRSGGGIATRGVENELEGVETPAQRYPATIPFLHLLNTLIHTPKSLPSQQALVEYEPLDTIPDGLGQPNRLGGIAPYVRFVVDTVLLRARNREYLDPSDKWKMIEGSFGFIERCLASYNLRYLLSLGEETISKSPDILRSFQVHPGFDLLLQFLTDSPLRSEILDYVTQGVDALESKAIKNAYFEKVVLRIMRIIHRVLEIQDLFIEILLPLLAQLEGSPGNFHLLSSAIVPFDQLLNWSSNLIVKIASCTIHSEIEETKLLAIKIVTLLSESPVFTAMEQTFQNNKRRLNRLAVILEKDQDSNIVSDGFMVLLQRDSVEDASPSPEIVDMSTGAGAPLAPCPLNLGHSIRLAILQLLLQNTTPDKTAPNVAHSLLGFYPDHSHPGQLVLQDPHAANSRTTCFHVVLELLSTGVPRTGLGDHSHAVSTFLVTHPMLAEQCYRLIHQLCSHRTTSAVTMRYLRTREDFFARQLSIHPFRAPQSAQGITGQVVYGDNSRVLTNSGALTSFLRIRAWVLESTALELHVLTEMGQTQRASRLLSLLFGSAAEVYDSGDSFDNLLQPFAPGQSLIRIIEIFQSFDLDWFDGLSVDQNMQLQLFSTLDVSACLRIDDSGCEIFDVDALLSFMHQSQQEMQVHGMISNQHIHEQLRNEAKYILTSCTIENNRRQIQHAKGIGFGSWKKLLDICLTKGFHRLPQDRRESIVFDLLQILPPAIQNSSTEPSTAVLLSESILSLVTKLRDDRQQQRILQSTFDDTYTATLPTDRLKVLLTNILDCLASSGKAELIRGNLYASLVNYLHLVEAAREGQEFNDLGSERSFSASHSLSRSTSSQDDLDSHASDGPYAPFTIRRTREKRSDLDSGTLAVINKHVEGLVSVVSTDAIDGTEVWKTVSFTLLDSLVGLSRLERPHRVLASLSRKGYLQTFVQSTRESDSELQQVLRPDPDNLNSLYVYESKMALLIRIAQTRLGAEKLLGSRLFQALAQCSFLDARPETDQSFLDHDSFLPSAIHRHHQLVLPALELTNSVLATLGSSSEASMQALGFLLAHRETFLILLRDNMAAPSLAQIREIHLLVSICSYVVPRINRADLRSPASGFGGIHAAILSLAARCHFRGRLRLAASQSNDTERQEATLKAPGYGRNVSIFDAKVEEASDFLIQSIWVYLEVVSDPDLENEFVPIFTPISASSRDVPSSQVHAPAPTISDSIEALETVVDELGKVLNEVTDLSAKLSNKDSLGLEEVEEIAGSSGAEYVDDLDMMQRRLLAYKELEKSRHSRRNKALRRLHSLEILLLLIWRHVHHYRYSTFRDVQHQEKPDGTMSLGRSGHHSQRSMLSLTLEEINDLLGQVGRSLRPTLERLEGVQLPPEVVGLDHRSREGYIEMMCRLIMKAVFDERTVSSGQAAIDGVEGLGSW